MGNRLSVPARPGSSAYQIDRVSELTYCLFNPSTGLLPCLLLLQYVKYRLFLATQNFFRESECKGTTFFRTGKTFGNFFSTFLHFHAFTHSTHIIYNTRACAIEGKNQVTSVLNAYCSTYEKCVFYSKKM